MALIQQIDNIAWEKNVKSRIIAFLFAGVIAGSVLVGFAYYRHAHRSIVLPAITVHFSDDTAIMQDITLYKKGDQYYAFFPAYANLKKVRFDYAGDNIQILMDNHNISSGEVVDISQLTDDTPLQLIVQASSGTDTYDLFIEKSKNLAAMHITTESGSTNFIHASKENIENANMICINSDGTIDSSGTATIKCHGNTTFSVDKKSYKIKFKHRTAILGMSPAKSWIVQGNVFDSSKIRNRLSYYLADQLGLPFAVQTEYVDLYINGAYRGNYMVQDSVNLAKNRIDIPEDNSFLIVAGETNSDTYEPTFTDSHGLTFTIKHPKNADADTTNAILNYINEIEQIIVDLEEEDSLQALEQFIDIDTFAIMYLVDELTSEHDTNAVSTYYYYDGQDGLLHAGPAWDFDRSLGNQWVSGRYYQVNSFLSGFPEQLWKNAEFRVLVKEKLLQHPDLLENSLDFIAASVQAIDHSVEMDSILWSGSPVEFVDAGDYSFNVEYVKWYYQKRFELIRSAVMKPEDYCNVYISSGRSGRAIWVKKGECIDASQLSFLCELYSCDGFALSNGALIWDEFPIFDNIIVKPVTNKYAIYALGADSMNYLMFIILLTPGLLALFLSGEYQIKKWYDLIPLIVKYGIYSFCVLVFTYAVMYFMVGVTPDWTNISFKKIMLQMIGGCIIGILARFYFKIIRPYVVKDEA